MQWCVALSSVIATLLFMYPQALKIGMFPICREAAGYNFQISIHIHNKETVNRDN